MAQGRDGRGVLLVLSYPPSFELFSSLGDDDDDDGDDKNDVTCIEFIKLIALHWCNNQGTS